MGQFVRASKFWKLLAQLAGRDFDQSFTPAVATWITGKWCMLLYSFWTILQIKSS